VEAKLIQRQGMLLAGMACNVSLKDVQKRVTIHLAEKFMARKSEINNIMNTREVFGLSTDPENYNPDTDKFEFFIGVEVSATTDLPIDMVFREVPKNEYVVFTFKGPATNAGQVHDYLYTSWLKNNNYKLADLYNIEIYDERSKGPDSEESVTDIYYPVVKQ